MPITNRFGNPIWHPGESTPAMVQRSLDEALADPGPDASRQGAVRPEAILHPPLYIDSIGRERGVSFIRRGLEVEYRISMEDEGAESRNLQEPEKHTQRRQYRSPLGDLSRRPNFLEASNGSTTRASGSAHHRTTRPTMPIPRAPTPRPQLARSRPYGGSPLHLTARRVLKVLLVSHFLHTGETRLILRPPLQILESPAVHCPRPGSVLDFPARGRRAR